MSEYNFIGNALCEAPLSSCQKTSVDVEEINALLLFVVVVTQKQFCSCCCYSEASMGSDLMLVTAVMKAHTVWFGCWDKELGYHLPKRIVVFAGGPVYEEMGEIIMATVTFFMFHLTLLSMTPDDFKASVTSQLPRRSLNAINRIMLVRGMEPAPKRHHDKKAYSCKGGRMSESEDSAGEHWKSKSKKQRSSMEDKDLSRPWVCEETDPFTPRIRYFDLPKRIRMPSHVKTYDRSEDPEDHLKIFQAAAKVERWAMPTWCHMFNSTLTGNARVWFDDLPPESIDSYDDLKETFLANYLQQKKCIKDPVEIHHIKQREGESTEDFVRRFKTESRDVKGAPEVMRISGFMHGITNPELIKRLHDKIPKSVDEMWKITTAFLRGEVAAGNQERKKIFPP
ncbi:reverse transcriptase domain-containing protein [Tanacetum coccineum]